jgi:hypothetical protein
MCYIYADWAGISMLICGMNNADVVSKPVDMCKPCTIVSVAGAEGARMQ